MNIKKIITSVIAGASMLVSLVGTGAAAQIDINVYGASAQYLFWNAAAPGVLANKGCTNIFQATANSKNAITKATCGSDTVYLRVSSKASFDGIYAMKGIGNTTANGGTTGASGDICSSGDLGDPGSTRNYYRKMVDESTCTWPSGSLGTCSTNLKCQPVTVAIADVAGESFTQQSHGALLGPLGSTTIIDRVFTGITIPTTWDKYNPIVVPFAFFANTSVKKCMDATPTVYNSCSSSANQQTITNLPRMMAVQIFSGQAFEWTDFGGDYVPGVSIVACMRHAGSGTHATLDNAVMNNGGWGANLTTTESRSSEPIAYFNDGSGDEVNCIKGSGSWTGTGAIGYSDADQATSSTMVRLAYNGEQASRVNIRNGRYDFWTKEWAYQDRNATGYSNTSPYVTAMITYAADPAHIPDATASAPWAGTDKTLYWATVAEMTYMKGSDREYPGYLGASNLQSP